MIPLMDIETAPPIEEGGAIHAASVSCVGGCECAVALVRSFAAQAVLEGGVKPFLHLFLDKNCHDHVSQLVTQEPGVLRAINLRAWNAMTLSHVPIEPTKHGKRCTMVRLYMPRLFPQLSRLIYLDADTLVVNSLRPLWNMRTPVFSMGENDVVFHYNVQSGHSVHHCPTWKNGSKLLVRNPEPIRGILDTCFVGPHGLNAGVLFVNLTGWRAKGLDDLVDPWSDRLVSGEIDMLMNDQDILNVIVLQNWDFFTPLPCEANLLHGHRWMCLFTTDGNWKAWDHRDWDETLHRNGKVPMVFHGKFGHGTAIQHWRWLFNRTNYFATLVNTKGLRNASSLCGVFGCERMVMEESYPCPCRADDRKHPCNCTHRTYWQEDQEYPHTY